MTKNKLLFTLALALAVLSGHATAQDVSGLDRFRLFNNCEPINLATELTVDNYADADTPAIDLTLDRIRTLAENRLRVARLYDADAATWLYVNVNVQGRGFSLSFDYKKLVYDAVSGETNYATTWDVGVAGTHGEDADFILQGLSEHLDGFILDYLRVNEDACDQTR